MVMAAPLTLPTRAIPHTPPPTADSTQQTHYSLCNTQYIGLSIQTPSMTTVKTANRKQVPWKSIKQDWHQAEPVPVAVRFQAWVCSRSIAGIAGNASSNTPGGHACLSLVSVVCCQVEVSASGWSLGQKSPTECGVSECNREASIMRRPWPTGAFCTM
jgi:hypothetical protein